MADTGNHRVQEFGADGSYLGQWGTYGSGLGEFNSPAAIESYGGIYVVDTGNNRVQKFY